MRKIFLVALLIAIATPALAIDTNEYPYTLIDQSCTDNYDTPTNVTPGLTSFVKPNPAVAGLVQISGSSDDYCDNDSRIKTGAVGPADVTFGRFRLDGAKGFRIFAEPSAISDPGHTWGMRYFAYKPVTDVRSLIDTSGNVVDALDSVFVVGIDWGGAASIPSSIVTAQPFAEIFDIRLNLATATSLTLDMSVVPY